MVTYLENIMEYRKKLLILICEFSKLARHKMNTQHSIVFLYTNNEKWEIKKTMPKYEILWSKYDKICEQHIHWKL